MSHAIKVIPNFIEEEGRLKIISIINEHGYKNTLLRFHSNPVVLVVPFDEEEVINLMRKYSDKACSIQKQEHDFDRELFTTEGWLSLWLEGSWAGPHFDADYGYESLKFSTVVYLNDDFEGGEISFPAQEFKYKPKAGDAVIFPASNEYVHEVLPVTRGRRYTIPMWHTDVEEDAAFWRAKPNY